MYALSLIPDRKAGCENCSFNFQKVGRVTSSLCDQSEALLTWTQSRQARTVRTCYPQRRGGRAASWRSPWRLRRRHRLLRRPRHRSRCRPRPRPSSRRNTSRCRRSSRPMRSCSHLLVGVRIQLILMRRKNSLS